MKKALALLLVLTLLFAFAACQPSSGVQNPPDDGGSDTLDIPDNPDNPDTPETPDKPAEPEKPQPTLSVTASATYISIGSLLTFTATGEGFDADALTFTFSDPTLTNTPKIEGLTATARTVKAGTLTVTVNSGDLTGSCTVTVLPQSSQYAATDPLIAYLGRTETAEDGRVLINNTAAGFAVTFYGKTLTAKLRNEGGTSKFAVLLDGETDPTKVVVNLATDMKDGHIVLADFEEAGLHTVTVQKITEEQISRASLAYLKLEKGILLPYEAPAYSLKMEVYGDSITAGYGNMRPEGSQDDQSQQNGLMTYAAITARTLGAEYRTFAQSGIGLYTNPYNNPTWAKDVYDHVSPASKTVWDMSSYTPDVVVINLGTNDCWNGNGSDNGNDPFNGDVYVGHYVQMVKELHEIYGEDTVFFLCSGLMENVLAPYVDRVAAQLTEEGITVEAVKFSVRSNSGHPVLSVHEAAATDLIIAICTALDLPLPQE